MQPLPALSGDRLETIKLLSFDADGVTVEKGTQLSEKDGVLQVRTKQISASLLEKINLLKRRFRINFTSGRSLVYLAQIYGPVLWEKTSIQGENGLFTLVDGQVLQLDRLTPAELEAVEQVRGEIRAYSKGNANIKGFEPKQFLISVHCEKEDPGIPDIVRRIDSRGEFYIYWNEEAYDIFPKRFNKGAGLAFLANYLKIETSQIMAIGNDTNDRSAMDVAGIDVTTSPQTLEAEYHTEAKLDLGGEEVVDHLLKLSG